MLVWEMSRYPYMTETKVASAVQIQAKSNFLAKAGVIIPTYNAGRYWRGMKNALEQQGVSKGQILFVDSSSTDGTFDLISEAGYRCIQIPVQDFRHGATRQMAANLLPWADFLIYLTQDAIPSDETSFSRLLQAFSDPKVGACYGRQLPRPEAGLIEQHARLFNYPVQPHVRSFVSRKALGIRAAFFSNSFAAYRRIAFEQVEGFPTNTIVSEEVTVAARMLKSGWKIAYQARAMVFHSHALTLKAEFSRYFDIGVHHRRERPLMQQFGGPSGEGLAFVKSEIIFLLDRQPSLILQAVIRTLGKWCGYNLGLREKLIPLTIKKAISGQKNFWRDEPRPRNSRNSSLNELRTPNH